MRSLDDLSGDNLASFTETLEKLEANVAGLRRTAAKHLEDFGPMLASFSAGAPGNPLAARLRSVLRELREIAGRLA